MKLYRIEDMKGGWFVGNFEPTIFKTKECEVSYKVHKKGEIWDIHYHDVCTEINLLIRGEMIMQNKTLKPGDIFVLEPFEIADPTFLEDCEIICVKVPSINDKISVIKKEITQVKESTQRTEMDFRELIKPKGCTFIQIGSNDGIKNENCGFREEVLEHEHNVIMIEPIPSFFNQLKLNYKNSKSHIQFENCAITESNQEKSIYLNDEESSFCVIKDRDPNNFLKVKCKTIHDIIKEYNITHIDGLFIDAEGYEYLILKNLFEKKNIPNINFIRYEFVLSENINGLDELLVNNGFRIFKDSTEGGDKIAVNNKLIQKLKII
jgi:FkbM family methyltransferase